MKDTTNAIASLAIVKDNSGQEAITYGSLPPLTFPISDHGDVASIDPAFLSGKGTVRLKHIKACLKIAGMENTDANRAWFNKSVRGPYHKALRYVNRVLSREGKPVSLGLSTRTSAKTGEKVLTGKVGYEVILVPAAKQVEDKKEKAKANSSKRAKRQAKKGMVQVSAAIAKAELTATPKTEAPVRESVPTPAVTA